ncbi:MAG: hypothetical protein JWO36_7188 [Myxococcales bacterium]|nr:hypothetical protein [Myxococcales bacterium]
MEAVRNLKVNLKLEGKPCRACQVPLKLAEDASVCTSCEGEHHAHCWESKGGCATPGCVNAPLKRLDAPVAQPGYAPTGGMPAGYAPQGYAPAQAPLAAGMMHCPSCRNVITMGSPLCPFCNAITSPDGIYHGPKINAPGAVQALVFGLVGLVFCQIIFGPVAISKANQAKREIASNPMYGGEGLATAGMVMGIIDLVVFALYVMIRMGGRH